MSINLKNPNSLFGLVELWAWLRAGAASLPGPLSDTRCLTEPETQNYKNVSHVECGVFKNTFEGFSWGSFGICCEVGSPSEVRGAANSALFPRSGDHKIGAELGVNRRVWLALEEWTRLSTY